MSFSSHLPKTCGSWLPAIAVAQLNIQWLTRRLRGQARSHKDLCQELIFVGNA